MLGGNDIKILEFRPPPVEFMFEKEISICVSHLISFWLLSNPGIFDTVLDSKGIRKAVQERQPIKALNLFTF
jgi:hypothetical protein